MQWEKCADPTNHPKEKLQPPGGGWSVKRWAWSGLRPEPEDDATFAQIVGGHLHADAVAYGEADEVFPHLARDMGEDFVIIVQFHAEHSARQNRLNPAFNCDVLFHFNNKSCPDNSPASFRDGKKLGVGALSLKKRPTPVKTRTGCVN